MMLTGAFGNLAIRPTHPLTVPAVEPPAVVASDRPVLPDIGPELGRRRRELTLPSSSSLKGPWTLVVAKGFVTKSTGMSVLAAVRWNNTGQCGAARQAGSVVASLHQSRDTPVKTPCR